MSNRKKQQIHQLVLLEEIRHLLAQNLLIQARIYDNLRSVNGLAKEDPTYETSWDIAQKSHQTVNSSFEQN